LCPSSCSRTASAATTLPAITHPEFFYGFLGVAIAWQAAFLVIAHDPPRFRPLMLPAVLEKLSFAIPVLALFLRERVAPTVLVFGMIDLVLGVLFLAAWWSTRPK
jgi:hypothetical protein